ncbi:MAG TPA: four helix bundle protein [Prosthecobacter sp.]
MEPRQTSLMLAEAMEERFLDFAVRIGSAVEALPDSRMGKHIAGQLIRSGTSPAPNYGEACAAESRADFTHKLGIVLKELRESRIWLRMAVKSGCVSGSRLDPLIKECTELMNITAKSLVTAKSNAAAKKRP